VVVTLTFEDGTIRLTGDDLPMAVADRAFVHRDERTGGYRAPAWRYADLVNALSDADLPVEDRVFAAPDLSVAASYRLRAYQEGALSAWDEADRRGVVELPTGSGKTVVALGAIERVGVGTLVVVPTIDLLGQWRAELEREFDAEIGQFGGGVQEAGPITVSTYASAYRRAAAVGDRFGLVVFDEVHHLGGEGYRDIARHLAAPARLGLTATFERPDDAHEVVADLVGPVAYSLSPEELAGEYLAPYDIKRVAVSLSESERAEYERNQEVFTDYLAESGIEMRAGSDYRELVKRSGTDDDAREALLAKQRAREIMLGADAKLDSVERILDRHRDDRIILFTAHNDLAYEVGERFLVPAITHQTGSAERERILRRFREGTYSRVVSSNVLDEGVDVPAANVGVVLSGTGSEREFTQRLGRILRPPDVDEERDSAAGDGSDESNGDPVPAGPDDRAVLYELVTEDTAEERVARRRRSG
jgi:superfamily II DNA or RNA helicase